MTLTYQSEISHKSHSPFGKEGWTPENLPSLKNKNYLITGANTGAGFEATKTLISKGASVIMLINRVIINRVRVND